MPELSGQVALVTGASTGIGRHLVEGLAARGMAVAGLARNEDRLTAAMAEVAEATGARTLAVRRRRHRPRGRWTRPSRGWPTSSGRVDLLVNNAGLIDAAEVPVWEADPDQWWDVVASHVRGAQLLVRAVVPGMLARGHGRVVNLASGMSTRAQPRLLRLLGRQDRADAADRGAGPRPAGQRRDGLRRRARRRGHPDDPLDGDVAAASTDWTPPERVVELVAAIAAGELDAWSGRFLRAGKDDLERCAADARRRRPPAPPPALRGRRPARLTVARPAGRADQKIVASARGAMSTATGVSASSSTSSPSSCSGMGASVVKA